jgi:dihydrolipoamide dehydrogenase
MASAAGEYDLCVIGGGPGGYVAAIKAAQLGLKTVCVERRGKLGGTCLNVGCIPSKSLLHNSHLYHQAKTDMAARGIIVDNVQLDLPTMMAAKDKAITQLTGGIEGLFKKNKVDYVVGHGTLTGANSVSVQLNAGGESAISAKNIMLATGSEVMSLPNIELDEKTIVSSTGALKLDKVPERLTVIGGGVIGLELGSVWSRLGSKTTVVEFLPTIGGVGIDNEVAKQFYLMLKKQGIEFKMKTKVTGLDRQADGSIKVNTEEAAGGNAAAIDADVVLVCVGRRTFTDNLGFDKVGIKMEGPKVVVNENFQTNIPSIYAIGDIIHGPMLAHKAEAEGVLVSEYLATGKAPHLDYNHVPSVVYTHPEVAWVGATEDQLKADNIPYKKGKFVFGANSRGKAVGEETGFVKVLAHKETDKLLGVHIVNNAAGELIAEACIAIEYGANSEDIARVCHAHPTLSEALKGAAEFAAFGKAINS